VTEGDVTRPDGRTVRYATWGDPDGRPLLWIHGTPGSRLSRSPHEEDYVRAGAHVVTFDRAGYGHSTPWRDRTVLDIADDALALADELGWERFSVLGISGGGPHALALGVRAPQRIHRLGVAVGGTPADFVDPDDLIEVNREGLRRVREEGRESLEEFLAPIAEHLAADPMAAIEAAMADAPEPDRAWMARPEVRDVLAEGLGEGFAIGPDGWFTDAWALSTDWGFALADVAVPVHLWYGELDRNVPINAVRKMMAELDVASFELIAGKGHFGWLEQEDQVLETLLADTAAR
jgi:pimeloyl-ACP methyl ester carboxylesterase